MERVKLFDRAYPRPLREREATAVRERRDAVRAAAPQASPAPGDDLVGLAISGGGIRSATFSLGVLRALAEKTLLRRVDFLSTVSGGGYIGAFVSAMFARNWIRDATHVEDQLRDPSSSPLKWLRENGRYMSPNGSGDALLAGAVYVRNWVAIHVVLGLSLLAMFLLWDGVELLLEMGGVVRFVVPAIGGREWSLWWSPMRLLPLLPIVFWALPAGWAYWFTQTPNEASDMRGLPSWVVALLVAVGSAVAWALLGVPSGGAMLSRFTLPPLIGLSAILALAFWRAADRAAKRGTTDPVAVRRLSRSALSNWLSSGLWASVGLLGLVIVQSVGQTVYLRLEARQLFGPGLSFAAILGLLLGLAQKFAPALSDLRSGSKRSWLSANVVAGVAAIGVLSLHLIAISIVAHGFSWGWQQPRPEIDHGARGWPLLVAFSVSALLAWAFGRTIAFLNLSSHQSLYGARLTRAYLGASNPERWVGKSLTEPLASDEVVGSGHAKGGPLHIVNVTVNETIDARTGVEQRDRKGLAMAIGPAGISVSVGYHGCWSEPGKRIEPVILEAGQFHALAEDTTLAAGVAPPALGPARPVESLPTGNWMSISGAAFTTGLGARTSLGLSTLLGYANVRLGYWWDSFVQPAARSDRVELPFALGRWLGGLIERFFPVQASLFGELLARFPGFGRRRWYLSDGGHFENTACYELLRRRLPFIIVIDNGCDPDRGFEDVANLVRKARLDFGAEIAFLDQDEIRALVGQVEAKWFEMPSLVAPLPPGAAPAKAYASLAWATYPDDTRSFLLFVKPQLRGDEPLDIQHYARSHAAFPQESTMDQYFDEAQWESYQRLGYVIGSRLFADGWTGIWYPAMMRRP